MFNKKKPQIRVVQPGTIPSTPPQRGPHDEELRSREVAKRVPTRKIAPSIAQMMEELTLHNYTLDKRLVAQMRKHRATMYLVEEVKTILEALQKTMHNFRALGGDSTEIPAPIKRGA
jgi:hypothetical protein